MSVKFSIVTPSFNSARFIRETIQSVISQQGEFTIEYFIIDNCSTDITRNIVEEFQKLLNAGDYPIGCNSVEIFFISQNDKGMYDAINKGFAKATGDIYAWINADDVYLPGAFSIMASVFSLYSDIHWAKGVTAFMTETSTIFNPGRCRLYTQNLIKSGIYGRDHYFIEQDSVFWRAWLWQKCGGIDDNLKRAGDYYLWVKFAEYTPLVSVTSWVSCFRKVEGQISQDMPAYMKEVQTISPNDYKLSASAKVYFLSLLGKKIPSFIKSFLYSLLFGREKYSIVLINNKGQLSRITGRYYDVLNFL